MMTTATIVCAVACVVLVGAEYKHARMLRIVAKCVASLAFIVVGAAAIDPHLRHPIAAANPVQSAILIGLVLGAIGDVALLGTGKRAFLAGLVAFLFGHLMYVLAAADHVRPSQWLYEGRPYAFIPIVVGIAALTWLWKHLGSMRLPVIVYVLVIVAMVVGAIAVARAIPAPATEAHRHRFLIGAVLFFISDLAVARDKFIEKGFSNRAWGLPTYYAGQLFIAWSLLY
jgi:uncharacterized membrane protein YhhN